MRVGLESPVMTRPFTLTAALLVILSTTVAAQPPKPGPSVRVDPCSLLTKADIKEVSGLESTGGTPNKNNAAVCDYVVGGSGVLGVSVPTGGSDASSDKIAAELNKRGIKTESAPGIGDSAFFAAMGYGMVQLNAFKGRNYVIVTLMLPGATEAKNKDVAAKLVNRALARF
jgi:hypothetical protein